MDRFSVTQAIQPKTNDGQPPACLQSGRLVTQDGIECMHDGAGAGSAVPARSGWVHEHVLTLRITSSSRRARAHVGVSQEPMRP